MVKENELIIKQLNMFGRVPQTYELLDKIEMLEQQVKKQKEVIDRMKEEVKDQYRNGLIAESTKIIILDISKEVSE